MIDCNQCPHLLKWLGFPDAKYGGRHWQYACGKNIMKDKCVHFLRSLTRRRCRYMLDPEQTQLMIVLDQ